MAFPLFLAITASLLLQNPWLRKQVFKLLTGVFILSFPAFVFAQPANPDSVKNIAGKKDSVSKTYTVVYK
jgi:hypothetical protein